MRIGEITCLTQSYREVSGLYIKQQGTRSGLISTKYSYERGHFMKSASKTEEWRDKWD